MMGKKTHRKMLMQKIYSMAFLFKPASHPLTLLDNNPIIVKNPGIPYTVSIIDEAVKRGLKILTEVELSYLISEAPIIAVTGTNGKTTVYFNLEMFKKVA